VKMLSDSIETAYVLFLLNLSNNMKAVYYVKYVYMLLT